MFGIAWRNFFLQLSRYRVLTVALTLGALVFTVLFGVTTSLTQTVREKAARYFSGDVMVIGFDTKGDPSIADEASIHRAFEASDLAISSWHRRSLYYETDARLVFAGNSLPQRRIIGVDFSVERENFARLDFQSGGLPEGEIPADGLWVSQDTAQRLQLQVGEEVTLIVQTSQGFKNTVSLKIAGIFQDTSFFGFASYLDFRTLNNALGRPAEVITELGVTLQTNQDSDAAARIVSSHLAKQVEVGPPLRTPDATLDWLADNPRDHSVYGVYSLSGRLKQVSDLIVAINGVNLLLSFVFLIIVAIGVYNTYQMIAFERIKEVGTMRALGMQRDSVVTLFLMEAGILAGFSSFFGLVLGALALALLCQVDFTGNLMAQMFLNKGHVAWYWPWQSVVAVLVVMWSTTLVGAVLPAWRVAHHKPVDALRHEG